MFTFTPWLLLAYHSSNHPSNHKQAANGFIHTALIIPMNNNWVKKLNKTNSNLKRIQSQHNRRHNKEQKEQTTNNQTNKRK